MAYITNPVRDTIGALAEYNDNLDAETVSLCSGIDELESSLIQDMSGFVGSTTCLGCIENQPNQLAHMEEGGCLYWNPSEDIYVDSDCESVPSVGEEVDETGEAEEVIVDDAIENVDPENTNLYSIEYEFNTTYSREDIFNIFQTGTSRPTEFLRELLLSYEEGEMIPDNELLEVMSRYSLEIPGFVVSTVQVLVINDDDDTPN
jgi:hypothetical protein